MRVCVCVCNLYVSMNCIIPNQFEIGPLFRDANCCLYIVSTLFNKYCRFKSGKVVIILSGRYAGRKAVVIKASDDGNDSRKFGHAIGTLIFNSTVLFLIVYINSCRN